MDFILKKQAKMTPGLVGGGAKPGAWLFLSPFWPQCQPCLQS